MTLPPRLLIAAPASGQGKTTVATGLMAALRQRGLTVSGHKVGPDYIDPGYHELATGRRGRNLDPFLQGEERVLPLLRHGATVGAPADLAIIEGVMGLLDGAVGRAGFASTAHVARLTRTPVLLVVDVSGASRSIAALVHGFATFDPQLTVAGVILNKVGSVTHEAEVREALAVTGIPVLGVLRRDPSLDTPSRHLGLVPAAERVAAARRTVDALAAHIAAGVDLDAVVAVARRAPALSGPAWDPAAELAGLTVDATVAVASGPAFTFRYAETDELLAAAGLRLAPVDPLQDPTLPEDTAGLYLGGGFPEVYAGGLADNAPLRRAVAAAATAGLPVVAECAGLLYLAQDLDGAAMAGVLPARAWMTDRLVLGYREASAATASMIADADDLVTGHEFHRTRVEAAAGAEPAWRFRPRPSAAHGTAAPTLDGIVGGPDGNVHASYLHVHWAGHPDLAARFAAAVHRHATGVAVPAPRAPRPAVASPAAEVHPATVGRVTLVGAGPGDPGLITQRGLDRLAGADVVVADRLVPHALLRELRPGVRVIDVSKVPRGAFVPQERINQILVEEASAGHRVVRLKGGDPFVFGRGMEEAQACRAAGLPVEVVPGISSAIAVPELAGVPVTHRGLTQGFTVVSAHLPPGDPGSTVDWAGVARAGTTIVLLMAVQTLPEVAAALLAQGMDPATPAVSIENGGTDRQRVLSGRLDDIAAVAAAHGLCAPAVTVVGQVAAFVDAAQPADA
ncbi:cobyrinate a,c-diamide synthase [Micromonospora sp. NPDC006766]|uniref:cobyrinate a,c-diamide synthase n=1 Tax=Micromonospora sp. NPDC006766 TaxID=3154778 RepID=UPI0033E79E4A